jgi:hypothetical protein
VIVCLIEEKLAYFVCKYKLLLAALVEQGLKRLLVAVGLGCIRLVAVGRGLGVSTFVV